MPERGSISSGRLASATGIGASFGLRGSSVVGAALDASSEMVQQGLAEIAWPLAGVRGGGQQQ